MKLPVSVLIITKNAAATLGRTLRSAHFAEEVIVVDAHSEDGTQEIVKQFEAKLFLREWTGFSDQRNFALSQAKHDWILAVDADEEISVGLTNWLRDFFGHGRHLHPPFGYKIHRLEYFLGKKIEGACWNPSYQDRFIRKNKAKFIGKIHEYPIVEGGLVRAPEWAYLDHNPNVTVESFLEKMNKYTTIEAKDRYSQGARTSIFHLSVVFFATWWKNFFNYKGYKDGSYGFIICLMEAVSRTVRHIKLWQLQELEKKKGKE